MAVYHSIERPAPQTHWQDFGSDVTLNASQAGDMYRAILGIKTTLRLIADYQLCSNSAGSTIPRLRKTEVEALVAGAISLTEMLNRNFEDLHV